VYRDAPRLENRARGDRRIAAEFAYFIQQSGSLTGLDTESCRNARRVSK
jgi:hypothetical protein